MPAFTRRTVQCLSPAGLHRMAYKEWGKPDNPRVLVCVHGVTRVSDDFDDLAAASCDAYRVICPDVVGRGQSDRLRDPMLYQIPQYVSDMMTLLARVNAETVHWVGTSMGGLIGMTIASLQNTPIQRLVLNDIGPVLDPAAMSRIGDYIAQDVRFETFEEAVQYIRSLTAPFGPHTDEQWIKLASDVLRRNDAGQWVRHYDLGIALPFKAAAASITQHSEAALWAVYDAVRCPTLLVRGEVSDLLSRDTAAEMSRRGPKAGLVEIPGVGHAPTFVDAAQIEVVKSFLLASSEAPVCDAAGAAA